MRAQRKKAIDHAVQIAVNYRVPPHVARALAKVALKIKVPFDLAFALAEQESGFRSVFGHDVGGMFPGEKVTKGRYKDLVDHIKAGGSSNGVGVLQITYYTYLLSHPKLWRMSVGIRLGLRTIKTNITAYGERLGLAIYNGGASNPVYSYADSVLAKKKVWHDRFNAS